MRNPKSKKKRRYTEVVFEPFCPVDTVLLLTVFTAKSKKISGEGARGALPRPLSQWTHPPRRLDRPPPNIFGLTPLIATRAYSTPAGLYSRLPRRRIDATAPTDRPTHNFRRVPLVRRRNGSLSVYNVQTTTIANARKNVK